MLLDLSQMKNFVMFQWSTNWYGGGKDTQQQLTCENLPNSRKLSSVGLYQKRELTSKHAPMRHFGCTSDVINREQEEQ